MHDTPSLWKQIAGAVIGGTLALGIYYGYEFVKPAAGKLTAYLALPGGDVDRTYDPGIARVNDTDLEADERKRFESRNRQVADRKLAGDRTPTADTYLETEDENPFTVDWPTYQKKADQGDSETNEQAEEMDTGEEVAAPEETESAWENMLEDIGEDGGDDNGVVAVDADELPSSGVETWILAAAALLGAGAVRYRKRFAEALMR